MRFLKENFTKGDLVIFQPKESHEFKIGYIQSIFAPNATHTEYVVNAYNIACDGKIKEEIYKEVSFVASVNFDLIPGIKRQEELLLKYKEQKAFEKKVERLTKGDIQ